MDNLFSGSKPGEGNPSIRQSSYGFDGAQTSKPKAQSPAAASQRLDAQSNLLGLLKFASPSASEQKQAQQAPPPGKPTLSSHGRGISASDLVASLRSVGSTSPSPAQPVPRSSSTSHQESLLRLLNEQSAAEENKTSASRKGQSPAPENAPPRSSPLVRVFGSKEATPTAFEPENLPHSSSKKNAPVFTYVNPFDQLSASSPLHAATQLKRDESPSKLQNSPSPANTHHLAHQLTTPGNEILQSIESPEAQQQENVRSEAQALKGAGAPTENTETVAEALNEVGEQVHKQMQHSLAEAERGYVEHPLNKRTKTLGKSPDTPSKVTGTEDPATVGESQDLGVVTYQIPMRPFVVIEIKKSKAGMAVREDSIVNIARFRKDFDQIDRTLASATKDFIVYGVIKNGGIRVIQQDNGSSSLQFPNTEDRIFNVAISSSPDRPSRQSIIGTGVSGAVYWTLLADRSGELAQQDIEGNSVIFPPTQAITDSTSNGQLKTRAKKSNRHPEFFAIGRGKSIQIVFPFHARKSHYFGNDMTLETERYFSDRSLKVNTGKTGKDFAFSEDDTVLATLDKTGKLRLWDVKDLVHQDNETASILAPIEIKAPILSFSTSETSEKSWPTSVLFIDKVRSYQKGIAQRYVLVGMKQNHTLQLWDLCLGKAVQELSFPHEHESDAICSVTFHPESSTIVVGHPTRNSIYIIQLSAPKFHLPGISQAKLVNRLSNKDPTLPKTEATAIMSNFREYSFDAVGHLRSVDLAPPCNEPGKDENGQELVHLFDLYVMHSKGVTCLGFSKEDLGISSAGKVLHQVDAQEEDFIAIRDLRETPSLSGPVSSSAGSTAVTPAKPTSKGAMKDTDKSEKKPALTSLRSVEKVEKKRLKQEANTQASGKPSTDVTKAANSTPREPSPSPKPAPNGVKEGIQEVRTSSPPKPAVGSLSSENDLKPLADGKPISLGISSDLLDNEMRKIQQGVSAEFDKSLQSELDKLHRRLDNDKQIQNATNGANQEAILRLVSKQLGDNVEKSLTSIVMKSIKESVTPSISDVTSIVLEKNLPHILGQQVEHILPVHLKTVVPDALARSLQSKDLSRTLSDQVTRSITGHVEREVLNTLQKSILPKFQDLAIDAASKASREAENRSRALLQKLDVERRDDSAKIDQLTKSIQVLSETIEHMAGAQTDFQSEILRQQKALVRAGSPTPSQSASMHGDSNQSELENVTAAMRKGNVEEGTILWLQSGQQIELFDRVFVAYNPDYLRNISPLVVLSVAAAVTAAFETSLEQRLAWTEMVLSSVDPHHPEVAQVVRKVMDFVSQRLSDLYMHLSNEQQDHGALRRIYQLTKRARDISAMSPVPNE